MIYLDTSAALKLVVPEPETEVIERASSGRLAGSALTGPTGILASHPAPD